MSQCLCGQISICPVHSSPKPEALDDPRHAMWKASQPKPEAPTEPAFVGTLHDRIHEESTRKPPKDSAREWMIHIHGEEHRGFITGDIISKEFVRFKPGIENVRVIEYAAFEKLERELAEEKTRSVKYLEQFEADIRKSEAARTAGLVEALKKIAAPDRDAVGLSNYMNEIAREALAKWGGET